VIISMTGFGSATLKHELGHLTVEIKTYNSRYLDFNFRLPGPLSFIEPSLRDYLKTEIRRGKVDVWIGWEQRSGTQTSVQVNTDALQSLYRQLASLQKRLNIKEEISLASLLQVPGVVAPATPQIDKESFWQAIKRAAGKAMRQLQAMRKAEGKALTSDILHRVHLLEQTQETLWAHKDEIVEKYRKHLVEHLGALAPPSAAPLMAERLEAEVLLFADKSDITEELVRLKSHLGAVRKLLQGKAQEPVGKPLEFLAQELLREVNTIAAKARDTDVAPLALTMKSEIEKIREQLQNLE
jgi:uncharacterized protein (TIGR00255 family)